MLQIDLTGKVALVTGGSRGIGRGIVKALAYHGADVAINYCSHKDDADSSAAEAEATGRRTLVIQGDVADIQDLKRLVPETVKGLGKLDILVNNAGISSPPDDPEHAAEQWDKLMDIHVRAQYLLMREAIREMDRRKWGRVINISSLCGFGNMAQLYCLSKRYVHDMTLAFAKQAAACGVSVNAVAPGSVMTDMINDSPEEAIERRLKNIPHRHRMAEPEEIGDIVAFLCSDYAGYIAGSLINVSGGENVGM